MTSTSAGTSLTTVPTTVSVTEVVWREVIDAYVGMWLAMAVAGETSDHQSPALARFATGAALHELTQRLLRDRQQGLVSRGRPELHPRVVALLPAQAPTAARVEDCVDRSHWLKQTTRGELVDQPGGLRRVDAVLKISNGVWKVTAFVEGAERCS